MTVKPAHCWATKVVFIGRWSLYGGGELPSPVQYLQAIARHRQNHLHHQSHEGDESKSTFGTQPILVVFIERWSLDTGQESLIGKIASNSLSFPFLANAVSAVERSPKSVLCV